MGNASIRTIDLLSGCVCVIILFLLLSLDAWRAIKRKARWFPGGFLVLGALTIQFISSANYSTNNGFSAIEDVEGLNCPIIQLVIDSGRLVICVFIAYLLPGFVSSRFRSVWANIGALAISVQAHVLSDMYSPDNVSVNVFNVILCTSITLLLLVSICTVLAGKTIRININQKVHSLVSSCTNCGNIGDHVLRCWIVVRCSQPEYIMARSVLSSLTGLLVTVCVILMVVKWSFLDNIKWSLFAKNHSISACNELLRNGTFLPLNQITFLIQLAFVFIGWVVVSFRWLTAVRCFQRDQGCSFQVEDFWTKSLIDLQYGPLNGRLFQEKRNRDRPLLEGYIVDLMIAVRLHSLLLSIGLLLQKLVVLLGRASRFLSQILFMPVLKIHEKIMLSRGRSSKPDSEFSSYKKILERITMPGESAEQLWKANESAFKSTKEHMEEGKNSSKDMIDLIEIIRPLQTDAAEGERRYRQEEKYLQYVGQKSWKMRAVSVIHFMLCYYDDTNAKVVDEAIKACSEAWPLMDFVESSDTEANLACMAADNEFNTLENILNKKLKKKPTDQTLTFRKDMKDEIKLISKGGKHAKGGNSMDWMKAAANFGLYQTSRVIGLDSANVIHNLRLLLANVIVDCLAKELNNALIEKCNKWAVDGEEEKIHHAAFIAGKAMGLAGKATGLPFLFQTSQGNNAEPLASVAASEGNKACGGEVLPDAKENDSCGIGDIGPEDGEAKHTAIDVVEPSVEGANATAQVVKAGGDDAKRGDDNDGNNGVLASSSQVFEVEYNDGNNAVSVWDP